jgi:pimeloyl-ACP methyl ester carboxylesterase
VVAIDLAGHGESGVGRKAWTMPTFGDDLVAVVERLALADAVLIGHSMGGDVIVEAALQRASLELAGDLFKVNG